MDSVNWLAIGAVTLHWTLVLGLSVRVIMRRRPVGVLLAWLALILSVPVLGILIYLFVGESRISEKYLKRGMLIQERYTQWKQVMNVRAAVDWSLIPSEAMPLHKQVLTVSGFPTLQGNRLELLQDFEHVFQSLMNDIRTCTSSCHLEFYIWHPGGLADELLEALIAAIQRGVVCRILLDAVGSKAFLHSSGAKRLKQAGVQIEEALPVGLLSTFFTRADIRNHRKLAVIDGEIAYTGSQNLVDPRYFKQEEGVGQWIDAMVRIEGPVVESLGGMFIHDWELVTGSGPDSLEDSHDVKPVGEKGPVAVQPLPSGPIPKPLAILQLMLSTIYMARSELIITTPYFVPDESLLTALLSAAHRGLEVTLVIPAKNDSRLVDYASRAVFDDLLEAGVHIAAYQGGLLHTKSITVDGEFCLFGSVNLDMRSLWLNFEVSLLIYNRDLAKQIREMQIGYIQDSELLDFDMWRQRSLPRRFTENAVHLLAPLL